MIALLVALLYATCALAGELHRPVIKYPDSRRLGLDLVAALPSRTKKVTVWSGARANKIPKGCADVVRAHKLNTKDITVVDVEYNDSDIVYALCHHPKAKMSLDKLIDWYGKAPGFLRTNARHVMAIPGTGASGIASNDNVAYFSDIGMQGFIHELGHELDTWCAFPGKKKAWDKCRDTPIWREAFNEDWAAVTEYANANHGENFAELTVHALYQWHVQGGIDRLGGTINGQPAKSSYEHEVGRIMDFCWKELGGTTHVRKEDGYKEYPVVDK
ncbi:hypothetical protein A1Q2_02209 [Trichosporon asahii var. asahii CBS 8904]|uniref:Uncharacterized protein n=1 Tax=Trichosporon asahii var. asahii (strain CBS 8904) TaxID=1220162 RepID=K1VSC0_TRIAC|nr:hypothetical protein A1Q2_02209 [Trichosporon asahii var. asahii CBS 8904]